MDPSLVVAPPAVGRPLGLLPFRAWRLTPHRVGDPATARLFARPYPEVADRLDAWRADGQLVQEPEPAVYVHEYSAGGLTLRGLVGALDISHAATPTTGRAVVPHEGIHPEQVTDLADRMSSWQLNPAPILLVHRGPTDVRELVDRTMARAPRHDFTDRAGQRHRVWSVPVDDLATLSEGLAGTQPLIADGHHRYAAYLRMRAASPGGACDRGLAMVVDQTDTPLFVGAIHRVLGGTTLEQLRFACPPSARFAAVASREAFDALAQDVLVVTDGESWATVGLDPSPDRAAVELLHEDLVPRLQPAPRRVTHHHSVQDALTKVRSAPGVAVLLPAPDFDLVVRIARAGRLLPEKATSFQPKPSTGVLIRSLRDE